MKLTTKSEYSILALIHMARNADAGFIKTDEICAHYGIPRKYLEQLIVVLKQNRLVKARRGADGGLCLAKPASEISLAEIIRLMDGALAPTESVSRFFYSETPLEKEGKVMQVLREIRDYVAARMEAITLADLI